MLVDRRRPAPRSRASSAAAGGEIPGGVERQARGPVGDPQPGRARRARRAASCPCGSRPSGSDTTARCTRASYPCRVRPTPALAFRASIAAACVVAAARLLPFLGDRVMHRDEALAVMVARRPLGELLETVQLVRGGAPLHFLLAKAVAELGGGLVATRAISAAGFLLAIVARRPARARPRRARRRRRVGVDRRALARRPLLRRLRAHVLALPGLQRAHAVVPRARARHGRDALLGGHGRAARPHDVHAPLRRDRRPDRGRSRCWRSCCRSASGGPGVVRCTPPRA